MPVPTPRDMVAQGRETDMRLTLLERRLASAGIPERLGPNGQEVLDWDDATSVGFYYGTSAANGPVAVDGGSGSWMMGTVRRHDGNGGTPRIEQRLSEARGGTQDTEYVRYHNGSSWSSWVAVQNGVFRGPSSVRAQYTPAYWDMWFETDTNVMMVGSKSGTWRRFSGQSSSAAQAWSTTQVSGNVSLAGRTVNWTLPTILESHENVLVTLTAGGSGFTFASLTSTTRNPTNTVISCRLMQIGSATTQAFTVAWQIAQVSG